MTLKDQHVKDQRPFFFLFWRSLLNLGKTMAFFLEDFFLFEDLAPGPRSALGTTDGGPGRPYPSPGFTKICFFGVSCKA